jgi:RNA polymerase sigma-70 factor (ECF subfamily)
VISDEQLARQAQQGERGAMAELFDRHYDRLVGYLYRLTLGDRALAEDLAQETFLRALRALGSFQPGLPFKPWLYAIASNAARNHLSRAELRRVDALAPESTIAAAEPDAESAVIAAQAARAVTSALSALPPHQREVLLMFYYLDLTLAEIAEALAIPVGTVKSRLSLGRERLRAALKEHV